MSREPIFKWLQENTDFVSNKTFEDLCSYLKNVSSILDYIHANMTPDNINPITVLWCKEILMYTKKVNKSIKTLVKKVVKNKS